MGFCVEEVILHTSESGEDLIVSADLFVVSRKSVLFSLVSNLAFFSPSPLLALLFVFSFV